MGDDKMMGMMGQMMGKMDKMMPMMEKMMGGMSGRMGGGMSGGGGMSAPAAAAPMSGGGGMGMDMEDDKMEMAGMMGMGSMAGGPAASMADSALPGFPGASHIYHIGATGFFLDHPEHISLTTDQQVALNKIKDQAQFAKSASDRAIEQAEQELAVLTAADAPDITKVEAKVRDIAKLAGDQRMAFIRSVGEAAKVVTPDQRKILTGFAPPAPAMVPAAPAASATPMPMNDM
jgi:Spy/CpxP family protein refolding chaperone